jgi:hypothetical protein
MSTTATLDQGGSDATFDTVVAGWLRAAAYGPPLRSGPRLGGADGCGPGSAGVRGGMADLLAVSQRVSNQAFRRATSWEPRYGSVEAVWPTAVTEDRRSA